MSKKEWELMTLDELEGIEEYSLSIPDFAKNYTLKSDSVVDFGTFTSKNAPSTESRYTHSNRDLTSSLDEIEGHTKGWNEEDDTTNFISSMNSIASEVGSAMSSADDVISYRESHEEAIANYETYMQELEDAATEDISELQSAIHERDELIDILKGQLRYCLEIGANSLELKQASERLLNLKE